MTDIQYSCAGQPARFSKIGGKPLEWIDGNFLYFHLYNFSPDLPEFQQVAAVKEVFDRLNRELYPLHFRSTGHPEKHASHQVEKIYFVAADGYAHLGDKGDLKDVRLKCPFDFKANPGTLAVQYPNSNRKAAMSCFINDRMYLTLKHSDESHSLPFILLHEILHMFLDHTRAPGDIMNAVYAPGNKFTQDSRDGLMHVCGEARLAAIRNTPWSNWIWEQYGPAPIDEGPPGKTIIQPKKKCRWPWK